MKTTIPEPAVSRRTLILSAGCFWVMGGLFLLIRAWRVLAESSANPLWPILVGLVVAVIKSRFVFSRVVATNIRRIRELSPHKDKICLFAFQSMESYLFVIVMVSLGLALRHAGLPGTLVATAYLAIGLALILSSSLYFCPSGRKLD